MSDEKNDQPSNEERPEAKPPKNTALKNAFQKQNTNSRFNKKNNSLASPKSGNRGIKGSGFKGGGVKKGK